MTPQHLYILRQALRQLGFWLSDEQVEAFAEKIPQMIEGAK